MIFIKKIRTRFGIMETVMHARNSQETGVCLIVIRDEHGMVIPHPFSSFVLEEHAGQSVGTQRNVCKHIAAFLNYLSENAEENEIDDFWDVSLEVMESYLNDKAFSGCSRDTISQYRNSITAFLFYLSKKKLLKRIKATDFRLCTGKDNKMYAVAPVAIRLPKKTVSLRIHKIETQLIPSFIHLAIIYTPEIALGIYFMFYGGLRAGEVVNLTKDSIELIGPDGKDGFLLHIKKHYFDGRSVGNTKKEREQVVLAGGETIARMYQVHMKLYAGSKEDKSLFFNSKGRPMDYKGFNRRFNKLKRVFIRALKDTGEVSNVMYAQHLETMEWSTHIGRGTYSNMLEEQGATLPQLAVMRGDSSFESSLAYLTDPSKIRKACTEILETSMLKYLDERECK